MPIDNTEQLSGLARILIKNGVNILGTIRFTISFNILVRTLNNSRIRKNWLQIIYWFEIKIT